MGKRRKMARRMAARERNQMNELDNAVLLLVMDYIPFLYTHKFTCAFKNKEERLSFPRQVVATLAPAIATVAVD